jgi:hypothetical protein
MVKWNVVGTDDVRVRIATGPIVNITSSRIPLRGRAGDGDGMGWGGVGWGGGNRLLHE